MIDQNLLEGNKYFNWYWSICNRAKDRILSPDTYVEKHHIYPNSIYGKNEDLIKLTAKEHYIVHLLLWWGLREKYGTKDKNTKKMAYAFAMMNMHSKSHKNQRYDSKEYSFLRQAYNEVNIDKVMSEESKLKISFAFKGEKHPNYGKITPDFIRDKISKNSTNIKTIYQYDLLCNFIRQYKSISEVTKITNLNRRSIGDCCNGKILSCYNYIWSFFKFTEEEIKNKLNELNDYKNNKYKANRVSIIQNDLENIFIHKYDSLKQASEKTGIHYVSIIKCYKGITKHAGGFKWLRIYNNEK